MAVLEESKLPAGNDTLAIAKDRVRLGPVPSWAVRCPFEVTPVAKPGDHLTYLLINRQVHADARETFYHVATRLETMQAVQHESQWRLQFEPRTQSVTLHWIRTRREGVEVDHSSLERLRFLQREEGLEGLVIDGRVTLLLVLEDVRPGDVLEMCYTIEHCPRLLPDNCVSLFTLPSGTTIAKYSFSVRFAASRPMKWKSSSGQLVPDEDRENGELVWNWSGENFSTPKDEPNMPDWYLACPWIQVSDCPDWAMVGAAFAHAWSDPPDDPALVAVAQSIIASEPDALRQIEKAIQFVQDDHRYLSVNIELGGQVPSSPADVVRRRYGDCKDLSFLLVNLLKRLGVPSRPMLVNTSLRRTVGELLPSPHLFNHAIVEFRFNHEVRWIDPTIKRQGGGALNRYVPHYSIGLPVDSTATGLSDAPLAPEDLNSYELRESILADTTGEASLLGVVVVAKGRHAELLRIQFETIGAAQVAKDRLANCQQRFFEATRVGELEYRDDRAANEFVIAETYEINRFLVGQPGAGTCRFALPENVVVNALPLPDKEPRRTPFALPFPCHLIHTVELEAASLRPVNAQRTNLGNRLLRFERRQRSLHGFWSTTFTMTTLDDSVAPGLLEDHRKLVEEIYRESGWQITLPIGNRRPRSRRDFGQLPRTFVPPPPSVQREEIPPHSTATFAPPPPMRKEPPVKTPPPISLESEIADTESELEQLPADVRRSARPVTFTPPEFDLDSSARPRRRDGSRRSSRGKRNEAVWPVVGMIIAGIVIFYVIVALLNR